MTDFKWHQVTGTVKVAGHIKRIHDGFIEIFQKRGEEVRSCMNHEIEASIFDGKRRYRRGKNRCHRCGHKKQLGE